MRCIYEVGSPTNKKRQRFFSVGLLELSNIIEVKIEYFTKK